VKPPELLAPAGGKEAFLAAMHNGANAIYMGGTSFSARANADNFNEADLAWAVRYAHLRGVKVYITVNTLLKDTEMPDALNYVKKLYDLGVDAVIMQDWGLLKLTHELLPELPILASTQMTINNSQGLQEMAEWGIKRVILARENTLKEIDAMQKQEIPVELEAFVHGALCICYSGQCLFSSMVGGRSGNRGRCAQPCRLAYELLDAEENKLSQGYLLSPKDLNSYDILPQLLEASMNAWKFEGRMKRPEYVATVISTYANALAGLQASGEKNFLPDEEGKKKLAQAFNRQFTTGYLLSDQGKDLMSYQRPNNRGTALGRVEALDLTNNKIILRLSAPLSVGDGIEIWVTKGGRQGYVVQELFVDGKKQEQGMKGQLVSINLEGRAYLGDRVFKTYDAKLAAIAQATYGEENPLPITFKLVAKIGQPLQLAIEQEKAGRLIYESDYVVTQATKHPANLAYILGQLERLGGSGFNLAKLEVDLDENIMLPASVLNTARREAIGLLEEKMLAAWHYKPVSELVFAKKQKNLFSATPAKKGKSIRLSVQVADMAAAKAAISAGANLLYLSGDEWQGVKSWQKQDIKELAAEADIYFALPRIIAEGQITYWQERLKELKKLPVQGILAGSAGAVHLAAENGWQGCICGDTGLNIMNSFAALAWQKKGLQRLTLSLEMNWSEITALKGGWSKECLVHGALPLMVSEHCLLGALLGGQKAKEKCSRPCQKANSYKLKDEKGYTFPLRADKNCRTHIFNGYQLCMIDDLAKFAAASIEILRLDLRLNQPQEIKKIVECYQQAVLAAAKNDKTNSEELKNKLKQTTRLEFTKGHYYRGVE